MNDPQDATKKSSAKVLVRLVSGIIVMLALFFLPAGTFNYWQAWVYLAVILLPTLFLFLYFKRRDPEVIAKRSRDKEPEKGQRWLITVSSVVLLAAYLLPGFDRRFGWSHLPVWVVIAADLLILAGFYLFFRVLHENRYGSRVIEVVPGQQVITSGPYAVIRHPMYVAISLVYLASPLALGSFWALLPALLMIPVIVMRIVMEERTLARDLPGYSEYMQQTRYRLIPGVW